jgi:hypothetical protein
MHQCPFRLAQINPEDGCGEWILAVGWNGYVGALLRLIISFLNLSMSEQMLKWMKIWIERTCREDVPGVCWLPRTWAEVTRDHSVSDIRQNHKTVRSQYNAVPGVEGKYEESDKRIFLWNRCVYLIRFSVFMVDPRYIDKKSQADM